MCVLVQCLYVTPVYSAFGLEYLYVFTIKPRMTGQTNSPSVDEQQRGICPLYSRGREKGKGKRERAQSKSVKESIIRCPNRERPSTMALLMAQCQGAAGQ